MTGRNVFFEFFKSLKWTENKKRIYFDLVQIKNSFAHFQKLKVIFTKKLFQILILNIVLWCMRKVSANFQINVLIFKVPVIFWKRKLCRVCDARATEGADFLELSSKK